MATHRQHRANGANAKRSTGPKTEAGRKASSRNAIRHGVLSSAIVVAASESIEEFDALRAELDEEFSPATVIESTLLDQLTVLIWRNRRLAFSERAMLNTRVAEAKAGSTDPVQRALRLERGLGNVPFETSLALGEQLLIGRYQVMLTNQMLNVIGTLRRVACEREA